MLPPHAVTPIDCRCQIKIAVFNIKMVGIVAVAVSAIDCLTRSLAASNTDAKPRHYLR